MINSLWLILPFIIFTALGVQTGYNILFESQAIDAAEQASIAAAYTDQHAQGDIDDLNSVAINVFSIMTNQLALSEYSTETFKEIDETNQKYIVKAQAHIEELIWFNRIKNQSFPEKPLVSARGIAANISSGSPGHYIFAIDTGNGYGQVISPSGIDEYIIKWSEKVIAAGGRVSILPFNKMVFVPNQYASPLESNPSLP